MTGWNARAPAIVACQAAVNMGPVAAVIMGPVAAVRARVRLREAPHS
jgi:hypothetical protein